MTETIRRSQSKATTLRIELLMLSLAGLWLFLLAVAGLVKHNLMLALDDRGKISCHKVNLCFIYLNNTQCIVS